MRGRSRFRRHRYRADRMRAFTRRVEFLEGERARLEALLAEALRYGAHHTGCSALTLLVALAETRRINLARPAWIEERDGEKLADLLDILESRRAEAA